jgi:DNA polymerase I-like protein with 3'-5' exonuclease and polymerase domains
MTKAVLDVETTTHNKGHPFDPRNTLVSYVTANTIDSFKYYTDPDFKSNLQRVLASSDVVVGFNVKFDIHWSNNIDCHIPETCRVWDCQLAEFIYGGQKDVLISLNECLERYGLPTKTDEVKAMWDAGIQTTDIPIPTLQAYNHWDGHTTKLLYDVQQQLLSEEQKTLVFLLGEDIKVLSQVERSGIKFDRDGASRKVGELGGLLDQIEVKLNTYLPEEAKAHFNWDSGDDLSCFLYGGTRIYDYAISEDAIYKDGPKKGQCYIRNRWHEKEVVFSKRFDPLDNTEVKKTKDKEVATHLYQTDEPTLRQLKSRQKEARSVLMLLNERSGVNKVLEMLSSIEKQFVNKGWEDNLMHGQYNQNIVVTGRLSSSAPNQQNFPEDVDQFLVSRYD